MAHEIGTKATDAIVAPERNGVHSPVSTSIRSAQETTTAEALRALVIDLKSFIPAHLQDQFLSVVQSSLIERNQHSFSSDNWTEATIHGLLAQNLKGKLAGIGCGPGTIESVLLALNSQIQEVHISDYDESQVPVALANVQTVLPADRAARVRPHPGQQNLMDWANDGETFDAVYACIPQAELPKGENIRDGENRANYIVKEKHPQPASIPVESNDLDLELNIGLLRQIREKNVLNENGKVYLTIGGRPGLPIIRQLIENEGFSVVVAYRHVIQQHPDTNIEPLVNKEEIVRTRQGQESFSFVFYNDVNGQVPIDSKQAISHLLRREAIFHDIFIIECTLQRLRSDDSSHLSS